MKRSEEYLGNKCTINWLFFPLFFISPKKGRKNKGEESSQTGFQTVFLLPKNCSQKKIILMVKNEKGQNVKEIISFNINIKCILYTRKL